MDITVIFIDAIRAAIGVNGAVFALAAVGLNIQFGYTGLLNFGHVGFMLVGAYGTAITIDRGGPLWLGVVVGMLAAVVLAIIVGLPTLRLRADYLAIVTIAIGEILRLVFRSTFAQPLTKGVFGIQHFADGFYDLNPFDRGVGLLGRGLFNANRLWIIVVTWSLVLLATGLTFLLVRSPWGRVIGSIREDEDAARSLGKNVFSYKLQSLVVGGSIGALAGIMRAMNQGSVNPDSFLPTLTFFAYAVVILGGPGTVLGPIVGAIMFWFLIEFANGLLIRIPALADIPNTGAIRFALVGVGLMLLVRFRPQGVFGRREEMLLDAS